MTAGPATPEDEEARVAAGSDVETPPGRTVRFGTAQGQFTVPEDFNAPTDDAFLRHFH